MNEKPQYIVNSDDIDDALTDMSISNELVNYFLISDELKNTYSLRELRNRYERLNHPAAAEILKLISATITFRSNTSPDMRENRNKFFSDSEMTVKMNAMADAIKDYQNACRQLNLPEETLKITSAALDYCLKSIANRLKQLDDTHDRIFVLYDQHDNGLKRILK